MVIGTFTQTIYSTLVCFPLTENRKFWLIQFHVLWVMHRYRNKQWLNLVRQCLRLHFMLRTDPFNVLKQLKLPFLNNFKSIYLHWQSTVLCINHYFVWNLINYIFCHCNTKESLLSYFCCRYFPFYNMLIWWTAVNCVIFWVPYHGVYSISMTLSLQSNVFNYLSWYSNLSLVFNLILLRNPE